MEDYNNCKWCGRTFRAKHWSHDLCSQKCKQEHRDSKRSSSSGGDGCFIATSVYGDYDHPIVFDLRQFRDNWLAKKNYGRKFIQWYYQKGPMLASWIDKTKTRKLFALAIIVKPLHFFVKLFRLNK